MEFEFAGSHILPNPSNFIHFQPMIASNTLFWGYMLCVLYMFGDTYCVSPFFFPLANLMIEVTHVLCVIEFIPDHLNFPLFYQEQQWLPL